MGEKNIAEGEEITISTNIDEKEVVDNENNEAPGVQEEDEVVDNENDEAPGVQEEDTNQNRELTAGENGDTTDGSDKIYEDRSKDGEFPKKAPLNEFPHSKDIPQPPPELKNSRNVLLDLTDVDGFSHVKKRGSTSKGLRKKIPDKKPRQIKKPSAAQRSWKTSYSGPSCCRCRSRSRKSSISASNH